MRNLQKWMDDRNGWQAIWGGEQFAFPLTQADVNNITSIIDGDLSPENLTCDGELSPAKVRVRFRVLSLAAADLAQYAADNGFTQPETYCI
jgi:hypothetical protein